MKKCIIEITRLKEKKEQNPFLKNVILELQLKMNTLLIYQGSNTSRGRGILSFEH